MAATASAFSGVSVKSGLAAAARSTNSATDGLCSRSAIGGSRAGFGSARGGTWSSRSPRSCKPLPTGHQDRQAPTARQELGDHGDGLHHLLEVVQHEQDLAVAQVFQHTVEHRPAGRVADAERLGDGRRRRALGR